MSTFAKQTQLMITGPAGKLEAMLTEPHTDSGKIAIICHPHPLQQGTMHNKVVTTLAKACNACGMPTLRFNYRGVGSSEGGYGNITGEVDDCLAVCAWAQAQYPNHELVLAGFSFGSYIAAKVGLELNAARIISIAPALSNERYYKITQSTIPWLLVIAEADEVVDVALTDQWLVQLSFSIDVVRMPEASHFFHGKLIELRDLVVQWLGQ